MVPLRLAKYLPRSLRSTLFGDREKYGAIADPFDKDWLRWREVDLECYDQNQRQSVGSVVNTAGHKIMKRVALEGQIVLEIGPGNLDHMAFWSGKPAQFIAVDINEGFMARAVERLSAANVPTRTIITSPDDMGRVPLDDGSVDLVLSFYSLEHLHPLEAYLNEILRVLKPGGRLVFAIPCEGGMGWGLGRYFTTRRWMLANGINDPGKIIAWEHPNFADDIIAAVTARLTTRTLKFWPLGVPIIDMNLVTSVIAEKQVDKSSLTNAHS